jgi:hypothetical protein
LDPVAIDLDFNDLSTRLSSSSQAAKLLEIAKQIFAKTKNSLAPRAVLSWLQVADVNDSTVILIENEHTKTLLLKTGYAGSFLIPAHLVLAGVYTIGNELEEAAKNASAAKCYLDGYILEQIGLLVLEKTANTINKIVEQEAINRNWGVGPLLSPGSVHGWDLTDQSNLCSHLPIETIGVSCLENGVFTPFNSLSFIVGIGPDYPDTTVGSPCRVCSNKDKCTLRNQQNVS